MAKKLTPQQLLFLEVLFDQAEGDVVEAKRLANYSETYPTSQLVRVLKDEIIEATKDYIARNGPRAASKIVNVLNNPIQLGAQTTLAASRELLDRAGIVKTDKVELSGAGIFILPPKAPRETEEFEED